MVGLLSDHALILAFLTIGLGAALGAVRVGGVSLGPAGALFIGLAFGANRDLAETPGLPLLQTFGLVLFTYTVGLAAGPAFWNGLRRGGLKIAAATIVLVVALGGLAYGASVAVDATPAERAGLFAGASTNTPALQTAIDKLESDPPTGGDRTRNDPVVGYSLTYPSAVLSMILVLYLLLQGHIRPIPSRTPIEAEEREPTFSWTIAVERPGLPSLGELRELSGGRLAFSRYEHGGRVRIATNEVTLEPGDQVTVFGTESAVHTFTEQVGRRSDRHLALDRRDIDFRRMVLSHAHLAGRRLADLELPARFGATVTRIRRGDTDTVASDDFVLALGDRLRIVGPVDQLPAIARELGDSERELSELDAVGFALGIAAGMLLGLVVVPLGGLELELGFGGGPLVVGLVLGTLARVGPITFQIPHAANLVLRQLGILAFLACAGLTSGDTFAAAVRTSEGLRLAAAGALVALAFAGLVALVVQQVLRQPAPTASGTLAGVETQPAALQFATTRTLGDDRVSTAYALVFPVAMIAKIVVVQLLV